MMFVKGSLSAQRFITAVDLMDSSKTERLSKQIWMRNWSRVGILSNKTINFLVEWQFQAYSWLDLSLKWYRFELGKNHS